MPIPVWICPKINVPGVWLSNNRDELFPTLADEKPRQILAFCPADQCRNFAPLRLPPQAWNVESAIEANTGEVHAGYFAERGSKASRITRGIEPGAARTRQ